MTSTQHIHSLTRPYAAADGMRGSATTKRFPWPRFSCRSFSRVLISLTASAAFIESGYAQTNLVVGPATVSSGSQAYTAINSITNSTNSFTINGSASVTFTAGSSITLNPGFHATASSANTAFDASINPNEQSTSTPPAPGYDSTTDFPSIPGSFTAVAPAPSCNDISGTWNDADNQGNNIGWQLTQSGNNISGEMAYEAYRTIDGTVYDCGTLTYTATGQSDGSSFSLSASIKGQPYDACGYSVQTNETETVSLSGRACGSGASSYIIYSSSSGSVATASSTTASLRKANKFLNATSQTITTMSAQDSSKAVTTTAHAASIAIEQDTTGSSTWTTMTPRFSVQYASYIPVDHIAGPGSCLIPALEDAEAGWLLYKGDAYRGTYRTTQSILAMPDLGKGVDFYAQTGETRNYEWPSSPANGTTLDSYPTTGDIYNGPYAGADEDGVRYDCYLWNDKGQADTSAMQGESVSSANGINLYGTATDPLEPSMFGSGINWNITVIPDTSDPSNPSVTVKATHTCYPAHIVKVNGTTVYSYQPPYNYTLYLLACLTHTFKETTATTAPVNVPPY